MGLSALIGDSRAPSEGFFGTIGAAWETGIAKVGSEILPNWVQSQANRQSTDQLAKATFDAGSASPRQDASVANFESTPKSGFQNALDSVFSFETGDIGNMPVLIIMGIVLVGIVIVFKKF